MKRTFKMTYGGQHAKKLHNLFVFIFLSLSLIKWDKTLNNYSRPLKNKIQIFANNAKKVLSGNMDENYMPPNPRRLTIFFNKHIIVFVSKNFTKSNIVHNNSFKS